MTDFEFSQTVGGYSFSWPDRFISISVKRLRDHSDGRLTGEVAITTTAPGYGPLLHRALFNFSSTTARRQLIKEMESKYEWVPWPEVLEELCDRVLNAYREGEPIILITSEDEVKPLEYLIEPIVPLKKPTVIFGDPGSGKSQLCVILNILIAIPWTDNPLRLKAPSKPITALFCDYEADVEDICRQIKALSRGMELPTIPLYYRRCTLPIADDIESIRNHIESIGAKAIFIDSISLAAGGDLNKIEIATAYFRTLRQLKVTSISVGHTSKDRESKIKTILGSVLFEAGARNIFEIRAREDEDKNVLDLALLHRKANLDRKTKPLGYRITYSEEGTTIAWHDPKSVPEFVERMGTNWRIIELLKEGPRTSKEIREILHVTADSCRVALNRLKAKNIVIKSGDKWGLLKA